MADGTGGAGWTLRPLSGGAVGGLFGGAEYLAHSGISYADYAIAMVNEIVGRSHIQERISVVRK